MVNIFKKNQLDSVTYLIIKRNFFALLSEVHKQKVEVLIKDDDALINFIVLLII